MATKHSDQFHMGRIPIKPYAYISAVTAIESEDVDGLGHQGLSSQDELAVCKEFVIDYLSTEDHKATYDMYIVDPEDRRHFINLSQLIRTMSPLGDADKLTITIEGEEESVTLKDIINYIYSRFIFPDTETEDPQEILEKLFGDNTTNTLLTDVDGKVILPITAADNVYDSNGVSLQTRLDSITRIGFASTFITVTERGNQFTFDYPFENYAAEGNYLEVRIGGTVVNKSRYYIVDEPPTDDGLVPTRATIVFNDHAIEKGRTINILFIYNSSANGFDNKNMSGAYLANNSVPTSKLEKVSDSFTLPDPSSVATSKALYNLYNVLTEVITNSNLYSTFSVDKSTSSTEINVTLNSAFNIVEGCSINILTGNDKASTCKLKINNNSYDIYTSNGINTNSIPGNTLIRLFYSNGKFYLVSFNSHKLSVNRYYKTVKLSKGEKIDPTPDNLPTVSYAGLTVKDDAEIFVYRNGIRQFKGIDYSDNPITKEITPVVRTENGEQFVFETFDII